jgi:protein-L-isoaspartate(D-aspartate) O-methyltransferase
MTGGKIFVRAAMLIALGSLAAGAGSVDSPDFVKLRKRMVDRQLAARDVRDEKVLDAMRKVPRHLFVPPAMRHLAYEDYPLPLSDGQTISQPYIVGLMTQALDIREGDKVLEIGTGSGYQAAVLACITDRVFTVEIIRSLAEKAESTLARLGYGEVRVRWGDGYAGWEEEAPFDAVIVTCAAREVPARLFDQMREGGRMVLPLGDPGSYQVLTLVKKIGGRAVRKSILDVRFVPMTKKKRGPGEP